MQITGDPVAVLKKSQPIPSLPCWGQLPGERGLGGEAVGSRDVIGVELWIAGLFCHQQDAEHLVR